MRVSLKWTITLAALTGWGINQLSARNPHPVQGPIKDITVWVNKQKPCAGYYLDLSTPDEAQLQ
jgi:hypothetical protein